VLLLVAALAAGGWYAWKHYIQDDSDTVSTQPTPCVTPSHPPAPAALASVRLQVLNGTKRVGLAHRIAHQLRQRGATVTRVGNTKSKVATTVVMHGPQAAAAALAVREQLAAPAKLAVANGPVALRIGPDFRGLATTADAAAARQHDVAAAAPSPPPCASP
jgi:hypothetical protein